MAIRVLIVDDNVDTADSFALLMSLEGFEVRCAHDGVQALRQVRGWEPDAACLDLRMPGVDGFELARRLDAQCAHPPVLIAITGLSGADVAARCFVSGFSERLVKPFDPQALMDAVRRWTVDEPADPRTPGLLSAVGHARSTDEILEAALAVGNADLGNVQIVDAQGILRIHAHRGFQEPFLRHFATVSTHCGSACGTALRRRRQVLVEDVASSPVFAADLASRDRMLDAGALAVVSSPIVDANGTLHGMVSCHYRNPRGAAAVDLPGLRRVARLAAACVR